MINLALDLSDLIKAHFCVSESIFSSLAKAVIAAPCEDSKDLSVCLANRSAVLFALKAYYLAMDDIKLALEVGYPKELRFKLLERRVNWFYFSIGQSK